MFTYKGLGVSLSVEGNKPVKIVWEGKDSSFEP